MIALFDSGNSRLHFGIFENNAVIETLSIHYPDMPESLPQIIGELTGKYDISQAAACSVNSRWRDILFSSIESHIPGGLRVAGTAADIGVRVMYDDPATFGVDRAFAVLAAYHHYGNSCVVIDAGTAVTVDAVSRDGSVIGGCIFPGMKTLSRSMSEHTDLPDIGVIDTCDGLGTSTRQCIECGISLGLEGAITRLVDTARAEVDSGDRCMITGGGGKMLLGKLPYAVQHRPNLVLEGLGLAYDTLPVYEK
ncbi:type III pantothenate kinase [Candidatus Latescibacterota bacterium]